MCVLLLLQDNGAAHSEGVLVLPSAEEPLQTTVPSNASGNLVYSPSSSVLDGADFSSFLQAAHKNTKVTGELPLGDTIKISFPSVFAQVSQRRTTTAISMLAMSFHQSKWAL